MQTKTQPMTVSEKWKAWAEAKIRSGLCGRCGKRPVMEGRRYCLVCIQGIQQRRTRLYNNRLKRGLCPHCGGVRENPGIIGCLSCNTRNADARVKCYDREKKAIYQMRLINRRRREGVCPVCGRGRDVPKFKLCSKCRALHRKAYYENRERRIAETRRRYRLIHKPKPICQVCLRHRQRCSCGKFMRAHHGQDSCLFTCRCGRCIEACTEEAIKTDLPRA